MRVIFTGDPLELERAEGLSRLSTDLYGVHFPMSAEVDVSHLSDVQKRKLLNNSHFRAAGVDAGSPVALVLPASARAESAERAEPGDEIDEEAEAAEVAALKERLANKPPKASKPRSR